MFRSKTHFEKTLDKATSNMLLEPDFDCMMQLCDMIRGGDIKARDAVALMRARVLEEKNPHTQFFALSVLDTAMKNCGEAVHEGVLTHTFLEEMKDLAKTSKTDNVKNKVLEMVQAWGMAFKDRSEYKIVTNLYNAMKAEGYSFPPPMDTADMFKSEKAPVWKDGEECFKCKSEFGIVQRKHHCRACGGLFCNRCTSKQSIIPKFGIEKEVRVCDACYEEINTKPLSKSPSDTGGLPAEYLNSTLSKESQGPPARDEQTLKEEEELQIALAMSLNEQENQPRAQKDVAMYATVNKPSLNLTQPVEIKAAGNDAELDPELARYLNRNYWEKKKDTQEKQEAKVDTKKVADSSPAEADAVAAVTEQVVDNKEPIKTEESLQNGEVEDHEEFLHNLRTSVEIFMNRMRSDQMRNRSIANDSAVQSLFQNINLMHPQLLQFMNDLDEKRLHYEALQDKLTQIRDARAALDALREEHKEKMRRAAEEGERLRQIQMAQKLQIMRQKKQEYLAYQRQMALQRMQEQEAARQARLEQHKQFIRQRAMQPAMLVQGYNTQYMPPQPNIADTAPDVPQPPGMPPGNYQPYVGGSYQPPPASGPQVPYSQPVGMANVPGQYIGQQQMQANQPYQQEYPAPVTNYQQQVVPDAARQGAMTSQMQGTLPQQDSYNMAAMSSALPQAGMPNMQVQQQVVATAPPPTPQPVTSDPQMAATNQHQVPQAHMMQMGGAHQQVPVQQQQYYQQPPQDQPAPPIQGPPPAQQQQQQPQQNLLISFD